MVFTNLFCLVLIRNYKLYFIIPLCSLSFLLTITSVYILAHILEASRDPEAEVMPILVT